MTDAEPVLSICIPTFNRSALLRELLGDLDRADYLPFPYEVIVVDNASDDPGYQAISAYSPAHYRLRYFRRPINIGPFGNLAGSLRLPQGQFCVYLADDDRLIASEIAEIVTAMTAEPAILATFAPWEFYDVIADRPIFSPSFEDRVFTRADAPLLAEKMGGWSMENPENAVFRTDALGGCLFPTPLSYFSFRLLARLIDAGPVAFRAKGFYRGIRLHHSETDRREVLSSTMGPEERTGMARAAAIFHRWATGEPIATLASGGLGQTYLRFLTASVEQLSSTGCFVEAAEMMDYVASLSPAALFSPADWQKTHQAAAFDAIGGAIKTIPGDLPVYLVALGAMAEPLGVLLQGADISFAETNLFAPSPGPEGILVTTSDAARAMVISRLGAMPGSVVSIESAFRAFGLAT